MNCSCGSLCGLSKSGVAVPVASSYVFMVESRANVTQIWQFKNVDFCFSLCKPGMSYCLVIRYF